MLFERQRLLLTLTDALDGNAASTDFQKLLFLYTKEWETEPSYDFVPYQFGSFSFSSYADKRRLIERGLLEDDAQRWALTETGQMAARRERALADRTRRFATAHARLRGDALIAEVYRRYPYYATRSRIAERVLPKSQDRAAIADYDALFATYERESLPLQGAALTKIRAWIEDDGQRVALTCYEAASCQCHRHCVADALAGFGGRSLIPQHL
jgi:hypothetical protein